MRYVATESHAVPGVTLLPPPIRLYHVALNEHKKQLLITNCEAHEHLGHYFTFS